MSVRTTTKCIICGLKIHGWKEVGDDKIRFPRLKSVVAKEYVHKGKHGFAHVSCIEKQRR